MSALALLNFLIEERLICMMKSVIFFRGKENKNEQCHSQRNAG